VLRESQTDGPVELPDRNWGWLFVLRHEDTVHGRLLISATEPPEPNAFLLLTILVKQAAFAWGRAALERRVARQAEQLADAVDRLQQRETVHQVLDAVLTAKTGEQGIAEALYRLTTYPIAVDDRFGNLRGWAGPGRPDEYPRSEPCRREQLSDRVAASGGVLRLEDRIVVLVKPHTDVLAAMVLMKNPDDEVAEDQLLALEHASRCSG
jgi:hypothetical protein